MAKYKIEFDRELCIGALACTAVAEKFWPRAEDGKVDLSNATYNEQTKKWELIIEEEDLEINKEAAEVCPVDAIVIKKIEEEQNNTQKMENNQSSKNQNLDNWEKTITSIDENRNNGDE